MQSFVRHRNDGVIIVICVFQLFVRRFLGGMKGHSGVVSHWFFLFSVLFFPSPCFTVFVLGRRRPIWGDRALCEKRAGTCPLHIVISSFLDGLLAKPGAVSPNCGLPRIAPIAKPPGGWVLASIGACYMYSFIQRSKCGLSLSLLASCGGMGCLSLCL